MTREVAETLEAALAAMTLGVEPGRFALIGTASRLPLALLADLAAADLPEPWQLVRESGETTVLVTEALADRLLVGLDDARVERDLVWIRFEAAMGWEVVGFLAHVTSALAAAGVPLGAISGFSRDHLFVAARYEALALEVLGRVVGRR
ncbi:MAG: ACT domain-containing protein [Planctomycetota bacterium]